jgi:hypothetical protein
MLRDFEVAEGLRLVEGNIPQDHPLLSWRSRFLEGGFSVDEGEEDRDAAMRPMVQVALDNQGDPYCHALALNILSNRWDSDLIDEDYRTEYLNDAFGRICDLAEIATEPILEYWIAGAARGLLRDLRQGFSAELEILTWRLGHRLQEPIELPLEFYITELFGAELITGPLAGYRSPIELSLARHLRFLAPADCEPMFVAVEMRCESASALLAAWQGRRQGVLFHRSTIARCLHELDEKFPGILAEQVAPWEDMFGCVWHQFYLATPLQTLADALLLVKMPREALKTLREASRIDPHEGDLSELELLGRVLDRCYAFEHHG